MEIKGQGFGVQQIQTQTSALPFRKHEISQIRPSDSQKNWKDIAWPAKIQW